MQTRFALACGLLCAAAITAPAQVRYTYEAAGTQATTASGATFNTVNFNSIATGATSTTSTTSNNNTYSYAGSTNFNILAADQYGGANGSGNYFRPDTATTVTVTGAAGPQHYFGIWWSGVDSNNSLVLRSGGASGTIVASLNGTQVDAALSAASGYKGNPNLAFLGANNTQNYVFINIYLPTGISYDTVQFAGSATFESDNHTFSANVVTNQTGTSFVPVPEPGAVLGAAAAMLATGGLVRRRFARG